MSAAQKNVIRFLSPHNKRTTLKIFFPLDGYDDLSVSRFQMTDALERAESEKAFWRNKNLEGFILA